MADVVHAVSQVPVSGIGVVLLVSCALVAMFSDDKKKDVLRYVKGVLVTLALSGAVFLTVALPKYFGYFKIDVMQPGVLGVGVISVILAVSVALKTMGGEKGNVLSNVPYPAKQAILFCLVFGYFFFAETELEVFWLVVGALPFNILYHLYYVKTLDKLFAFALKANERFDEKFMAKTADQ